MHNRLCRMVLEIILNIYSHFFKEYFMFIVLADLDLQEID